MNSKKPLKPASHPVIIMHEMGVVLNIVRGVTQAAAANQVSQVAQVTVEVGELSGIVPHYLKACWPVAAENTVMDGATLIIEEVAGIGICLDCGTEYRVMHHLNPDTPLCPHCQSSKWQLKIGRDVVIKNISCRD